MIWNTGQVSTVDRPNGSKLMLWIRDVALKYDSDDCLIWPFSGSSNGYGSTVREGKKLYIHRYICELVHGPAPTPKHHAAHSCDNGPGGCVNFKHLSWKTSAENQLDRFRGHRRKMPRDKLQPGHIAAILALKGTESPQVTANRFGISEAHARHIQTGRYRHVENASIYIQQRASE